MRAGRFREAARLRAAEQETLAKVQGAESRGPVNALVSLADFYAEAGRRAPEADQQEFRARASETYGRALEISARKSYTAAQVDALDGLARLNLDQKNFAEAERHYKLALEMREAGKASQVWANEKTLDNLEGLALAASGLGRHAEAEAYLQRALKFYDGLSTLARNEMVVRRVHPQLLRHALSARLAEVNRALGRPEEADEQYRHLLGPLTSVKREFLDVPVNAERYLYAVESAGRFYSERGDPAAAESFYVLVWPATIRPVVQTLVVWPDAYSESLLAQAPASSLDAVIRILESYAALLKKQGRDRDADLIDFGVNRVRERLLNEMPTMPLS